MSGDSNSPLIIIGMHRSGTSLLSEVIENLGIYMGGSYVNDQHEARYFVQINRWLLTKAGGNWDYPEPAARLVSEPRARTATVSLLKSLVQSPRVVEYLGWLKYWQYRRLDALDFKWGWKDPRTTILLPLWLEVFPNAKILHIYRNGVDVAHSLYVREQKHHDRLVSPYERADFPNLYWLRIKRNHMFRSLRCLDLQGAFDLWKSYVDVAHSLVESAGVPALELRYENLLAKPNRVMRQICDFCELPVDENHLQTIADRFHTSKAYKYRQNDELVAFARKNETVLRMHGYH